METRIPPVAARVLTPLASHVDSPCRFFVLALNPVTKVVALALKAVTRVV